MSHNRFWHAMRRAAPCLAAIALPAFHAAAADPSSVTAAGITLRSVHVELPTSSQVFTGDNARAANANCLTCHSAGMVLNQPVLPEATWRAEVEKMRAQFKAPIDPADMPAIVAYLVGRQTTH